MVNTSVTHIVFFSILICFFSCNQQKVAISSHQSDILKVNQLTESTYLHLSYLQTESFGKVGCNGMIVADNGEAIVYDTPVDSAASVELMNWIESELKSKIVAIVPTHFHSDCLGGLSAFHARGIPSYANNLTITFADSNGSTVPQNGFTGRYEHRVGQKKVLSEFFGAGHTHDNIVGYVPDEGVLFGGCLVKSLKAGKGYLGDADTTAWSATALAIKKNYPDAKIVIPGHGKVGDQSLLDYTNAMFKQ